MKKLFSMLLAMSMAFSLAACGAGTASDPQESQPGGALSVSEPPASAEPEPAPNPTEEPPDSAQEPGEEDTPSTLVAYFSATGNTEGIAQHLQAVLDADLYEIVPAEPYSDDDLNYNVSDCRANQEQNDPDARPAIDGSVDHMEDYEVIFLGYPIWWGDAPKIISTFLESYDFTGKTIVPFCTSGSSGIGSSASALESLTSGATWLGGQRFPGFASQDTVAQWVNGLGLELERAA